MRERERRAIEKRQALEECFEGIKLGVAHIFSHPVIGPILEDVLLFPGLDPDEQTRWFEDMIKRNAALCLHGDPKHGISSEVQCHSLIEMVDHLAHARPALERAVKLFREAGEQMPTCLKEWAEDPGEAPPQRRGPRSFAQDWKALRDQIIGMAVITAVAGQKDPRVLVSVPIRCSSYSKAGEAGFSICRAVLDVLHEHYGTIPNYHPPTYGMVHKAWERYRDENRRKGKRRPGRPLLPPGGLDSLIRPDGIETASMQKTFRKMSEEHLSR